MKGNRVFKITQIKNNLWIFYKTLSTNNFFDIQKFKKFLVEKAIWNFIITKFLNIILSFLFKFFFQNKSKFQMNYLILLFCLILISVYYSSVYLISISCFISNLIYFRSLFFFSSIFFNIHNHLGITIR